LTAFVTSRCARLALSTGCLVLGLPGCFDGRLDSFEIASAGGGQAGGGHSSGAGGAGGALAGAGGTGVTGGIGAAGAAGGISAAGGTGATSGTDASGGSGAAGGTDAEGGTGAAGGTDAEGGTGAEGGTDAAGGTGGTGGSAPSTLLLDDFEDQNHEVEPDGWWYPADDSSGPVALMTFDAITERGDSRFAVHLAAGPTTDFGAFLGLDMPGPLFDATAYSTLRFWTRLDPPGELSVRFLNSLGEHYATVVQADLTWREIQLPLSGFSSLTDGTMFDGRGIGHLQFWLPGTNPAFHLYVDDVWLLRDP
jgi:hypothetical protein